MSHVGSYQQPAALHGIFSGLTFNIEHTNKHEALRLMALIKSHGGYLNGDPTRPAVSHIVVFLDTARSIWEYVSLRNSDGTPRQTFAELRASGRWTRDDLIRLFARRHGETMPPWPGKVVVKARWLDECDKAKAYLHSDGFHDGWEVLAKPYPTEEGHAGADLSSYQPAISSSASTHPSTHHQAPSFSSSAPTRALGSPIIPRAPRERQPNIPRPPRAPTPPPHMSPFGAPPPLPPPSPPPPQLERADVLATSFKARQSRRRSQDNQKLSPIGLQRQRSGARSPSAPGPSSFPPPSRPKSPSQNRPDAPKRGTSHQNSSGDDRARDPRRQTTDPFLDQPGLDRGRDPRPIAQVSSWSPQKPLRTPLPEQRVGDADQASSGEAERIEGSQGPESSAGQRRSRKIDPPPLPPPLPDDLFSPSPPGTPTTRQPPSLMPLRQLSAGTAETQPANDHRVSGAEAAVAVHSQPVVPPSSHIPVPSAVAVVQPATATPAPTSAMPGASRVSRPAISAQPSAAAPPSLESPHPSAVVHPAVISARSSKTNPPPPRISIPLPPPKPIDNTPPEPLPAQTSLSPGGAESILPSPKSALDPRAKSSRRPTWETGPGTHSRESTSERQAQVAGPSAGEPALRTRPDEIAPGLTATSPQSFIREQAPHQPPRDTALDRPGQAERPGTGSLARPPRPDKLQPSASGTSQRPHSRESTIDRPSSSSRPPSREGGQRPPQEQRPTERKILPKPPSAPKSSKPIPSQNPIIPSSTSTLQRSRGSTAERQAVRPAPGGSKSTDTRAERTAKATAPASQSTSDPCERGAASTHASALVALKEKRKPRLSPINTSGVQDEDKGKGKSDMAKAVGPSSKPMSRTPSGAQPTPPPSAIFAPKSALPPPKTGTSAADRPAPKTPQSAVAPRREPSLTPPPPLASSSSDRHTRELSDTPAGGSRARPHLPARATSSKDKDGAKPIGKKASAVFLDLDEADEDYVPPKSATKETMGKADRDKAMIDASPKKPLSHPSPQKQHPSKSKSVSEQPVKPVQKPVRPTAQASALRGYLGVRGSLRG